MASRKPPLMDQLYEVYVDESSQTKHRYLAMGALVVPSSRLDEFLADLRAARLPELPNGEMAWIKVSKAKLVAYQRFVDVFFRSNIGKQRIEFHSLYVDTSKLKDHLYNKNSREIGFNKEVFQIVRKCATLHPTKVFHVYLDRRTTKSKTEDLRFILNRKLQKEGDKRDWPFRRVQFRDSDQTLLLQMADILLGSITFRLNGHIDALGASPAKCELPDHIKKGAGYHDAHRGTHRIGKFTIWERAMKPGVS